MAGRKPAITANVLDTLYSGEPFGETMTALAEISRQSFGADAVMQFQIINPVAQSLEAYFTSARATDAMKAEYLGHYLAIDRRVPQVIAKPGKTFACYELVDEVEHERSALVCDFLDRPDLDVRWCIASFDHVAPDAAVLTAALRPRREGRFLAGDIDRLDLLRPHLLTQIKLNRQLKDRQAALVEMADAFDAAPEAMLVVDRSLRIHAANGAAEVLLTREPRLALVSGQLRAMGDLQSRLLRSVTTAVLLREGTGHSPPQALSLPATDSVPALRVLVYPLPRAEMRRRQARKGEAVLVLRSDRGGQPKHVLRQLGLSSAEAEIAECLARGMTTAGIAEARGVTVETVRTQIKGAMAKTETRRQSDLVRIVLSLA